MKKTVYLFIAAFAATFCVNAQEISDNAIGLRAGGGDGFGTEVSYQRALSGNNRLEFDLGIEADDDFNAFQLTGIYHWVWNIDGGFNWYAGPGAGIAVIDFDDDFPGDDDSESALFLAGQVGIEYNFDIPLQLSIDTRPAIYFGDNRDDFELFDLALGIRYQF